MAVLPYKNENLGKKEQVAQMFNNIASHYDFLNHFLSLGIDIYWRKKALKLLKARNPQLILDVATGTGDFALEALKVLSPKKVIGVDISVGMLEFGKRKILKQGLEEKIELLPADSENLPFDYNTFDAATVAFGVRNFENLENGLENIFRVLKPGGDCVILEFSKPQRFPVRQLYNFYFKNILPLLGRLVSKDNSAYTYLPESVQAFPQGDEFLKIFNKIGFKETKWISLTFGISAVYHGKKPI